MSNETYLTIRGYVGGDPTVFHNDQNRSTTVVRIGVTARNFDRRTNTFADGVTAWYTARCYGELADNVAHCVKKGNPVIVRGRLSPRQWSDKEGNIKTDNVIVAESLGIDLNTGTASFVRTRRAEMDPVEGEPASAASNGEPVSNSEPVSSMAPVISPSAPSAPSVPSADEDGYDDETNAAPIEGNLAYV